MTEPGTPTLDQLRVLLAVIEAGTLAGAGRRLGRATSAVSYAIDNLEAQLGVPLFERRTTHRPVPTEAGKAVAAEACQIARGVDSLRAKVKGMLGGIEAELSLAVDVMLPTERLVDALQAFRSEFPTVGIRLHVDALGAVMQRVLDGTADLAISGPLPTNDGALEHIPLKGVEMIPVAAPGHPLATGSATGRAALGEHVQLVLTDRSTLTQGQDFGVLALRTWRIADLGAKHALLRAGIGWGNMPEPTVRDDLAAGRLVALDLPGPQRITYALSLLYAAASPPGPAGRWLIERFVQQG
jgi:DNA-binding transcriptional LysR family regulator